MSKKTTIRECMGTYKGKGGIVRDTIKEIPSTIKRGVGSGVKGVKDFVKGRVRDYIKKQKTMEDHRVKDNTKMIEDNWGSVENYKILSK